MTMLGNLWQDVRYTFRTFVRAPAFVAIAVFTMAVGIGANTAIFSVVSATLLRPLQFPRSDELALIIQTNKVTRRTYNDTTPANYLDWRARNNSFSGITSYREGGAILSSGPTPERRAATMVNSNFFDVLEIHARYGRTFTATDEGPGAARVAILSDAIWRERFGGDPSIVGQSVRLDDVPHTVIGVMPPGMDYPYETQIWTTPHWRVIDDPGVGPAVDPSTERGHGYFFAIGRIKRGVSFSAAAADMARVGDALERDFPDDNAGVAVDLLPLRDEMVVSDVRSTTLLVFAAVGLLLLIATANVSGLLMARATVRHQEIALRAAIGASRGRLIAQFLTESLVLALLGGLAGVILALWLVPALVALSPADLNATGGVAIDGRVLTFSLAISALAGILCGLAPARQLSGMSVNDALKQSARGAVSVRQRRLRATIVCGEIALSMVLLVTASLTVRSFMRLQHVDSGFTHEGVQTMVISPSATRYAATGARADFWEHLVSGARQIPGVTRAAATSRLPLLPGNSTRGLTIPGMDTSRLPSPDYRTISPDYFSVMGIPVVSGRGFTDADREDRPIVVAVSASAAQRFWPGRDPLGQQFQIAVPGPTYTIVSVVGDVRSASLEAAPLPTIYVPYRQDPARSMVLVMKTPLSAAAITGPLRDAIHSVDKDQPIGAIRSMDEQISRSLQRRRFGVTLLSSFGAIAVGLAAVGLYGVLAFIVSQRRREIGVRIALGASTRDVVRDVLGQGLQLVGVGLAVGLLLALAAARIMSSLLFATSATDLASFGAAALLLATIAIAASLLPALRASRVDPLVALRDE